MGPVHFFRYVMIVTEPKPDDAVPLFHGMACMLQFVIKKTGQSPMAATQDYVSYAKEHQ